MEVSINLNQLNSNQGIHISGRNIIYGDFSGYSVSSIGDVNGDNYTDIIIGAPSFCGTSYPTNQGRCYIIYGGLNLQSIDLENLNLTQGFSIYGQNNNDCTCESVGGGADINKDGFDDILVGAPYAMANGVFNSGKTYVIYGKENNIDIDLLSFTSSQGFIISGENAGDYSGSSVNFIGDSNNDGFDDIVIGAPGANSETGVTYVVFGKPTHSNLNLFNLSSSDGYKIFGANHGDKSGSSVNYLGDYNKDGIDDFIIAAPEAYSAGSVYIIFGSNNNNDKKLSELNISQGLTIIGCTSGDLLGTSLSSGDINGDGNIDIVIGSPGAYKQAGASYIIFANSLISSSTNICDLLNNPSRMVILVGVSKEDNFGYSVSSFGDINNDGFDDVLVGAWGSDTYQNNAGTSYVIYGKSFFSSYILYVENDLTDSNGFAVFGPTEADYSGFSLSGGGDINNDGFDDIVIGAYGANNYKGLTYILWGSKSGFITSAPTFSPTVTPTSFSIINQEQFFESTWFEVTSSVVFFLISATAGYVFREKVIFHILSNWGYKYKLLFSRNDFLNAGEIGFTLKPGNFRNTDKLFCVHGNRIIKVSIDNGNNHGLSEGIYNLIVQELKQPNKAFHFLASEKCKILDFLLSRPDFIDFLDLGYIKGTIYKNLLNTDYKQKYEDKYKYNIRNDVDLERFSHDSDSLFVISGNPIHDSSENQGIEEFANSQNAETLQERIFTIRESIERSNNFLSEARASVDIIQQSKALATAVVDCIKVLGKQTDKESEFIDKLAESLNKNYKELIFRSFEEEAFMDKLITSISMKFYSSIIFSSIEEDSIVNSIRKRSHSFVNFAADPEQKLSLKIDKKLKSAVEELMASEIQEDSSIKIDIKPTPVDHDAKESDTRESHILEVSRKMTTDSSADQNKRQCVVMSIDAMMDPEHVLLQNEEFERFGKDLVHIAKELLMIKPVSSEVYNQAVTAYEAPTTADNSQFSCSDNFMISLLSARQIVEYLPMFKHILQSTINHVGYNATLPEVLDNKAALVTTHLILGNAAAQFLPVHIVTTGMIVSNIGTGAYAVRLIAADYLKAQQPTDEPMEIVAQCVTAIMLYNLPNLATYAAVQLMLPGNAYTITGYDILASSSLGVIHCSSNYKAISEQPAEPTTADTAVPLIIDTAVLLMLGKNLNIGASSIGMLMMSIKNCMSVATSVYATDSITKVVMDMVPSDVKEEYLDLTFNVVSDFGNTCYQTAADVSNYLAEGANLIMDYMGVINHKEVA